MGMYTGLRFKGFIKEEYREDIRLLMTKSEEWKACKHEELKKFGKLFRRSSFIPFGSLAYMPDCWEGDSYDKENPWNCPDTDGFDRRYDMATGYWSFQCSLKNYEGELDYFLEHMIPIICDKLVHCEKFYEEWDVSNLYELKEGKLNKLDYGIRYEEDESDYIPSWFANHMTEEEKTEKKSDPNILYKDFDFEKEERENGVIKQ